MLPVSAMSINCFMLTGQRAKATFISPLSTRSFNSPRPRIPPTKSIRLSERRSLIPRTLSSMRLEEIVTSSTPIGSLSSYVPSLAVKLYHLPSKQSEKLCNACGLQISSPFSQTMKFLPTAAKNSSALKPFKSLTTRLQSMIVNWLAGKQTAMKQLYSSSP